MTGKLSKNFHGVGIGPLSNILAVKKVNNLRANEREQKEKKEPKILHLNLRKLFPLNPKLIWFLSVKIGVKVENLLRLIYMVKFTWQDLEKKLTQG